MSAPAPSTDYAATGPSALHFLPCLLFVILALLPSSANGLDPGARELEEVLVTANRRESALLDTPAAITAFTAGSLRQFSITGARDLVVRTPSLSMTGTPGKISIRGVGRPNNALGSDPGVAIYSDGVYTTGAGLFEDNNLFDTERVEILRGPQGTLYGRNAIGGAINIISMPPSPVWKSRVNLELGNYDYQALQGFIRGPITDQLSMVASGSTIERSGFRQEVTSGEDFDDRDTRYLRLSFKYHWNNIWYSRVQFADVTPGEKAPTRSVYLLNEVALGDFRIKHLASYDDYDYRRLVDNDGTDAAFSDFRWSKLYLSGVPVSALTGIDPAPPMVTDNIEQQADVTSQDLQFYSQLEGQFNFVSGLYYHRSDENQYHAVRENNDDVMAVYAFLGNLVGRNTSEDNWLYRGSSHLVTTSWAAYGQGSWDFSRHWRLTAGLRYSQDDRDGRDRTFAQWVGDGTVHREAGDNWDSLDWRLGLDYRPTDNQMLYGVLATGYRSGGFNLMQPTASTEVDRVDPEDLLSLELGYKGALPGKRLQLSAAAYYYDYQDIQVFRDDIVEGVAVRNFSNAAQARAWGLEAEASALLGQYFTLGGALSWNQSRYDEYTSVGANACALGPLAEGRTRDPLCTEAQDLGGNHFPLTPRYKLNLWTTARWDWAWASMEATISYSHVGEQYLSPFNTDRDDRIASRDRWDGQLGASHGPWSLTAFVNNIADERNWIYRQRPSPVSHNYGPNAQLSEPRTWGLRLSHNL